MIITGWPDPPQKTLKCSKCDGRMDWTETYEEWQKSGKALLCEDCWPPVKDAC